MLPILATCPSQRSCCWSRMDSMFGRCAQLHWIWYEGWSTVISYPELPSADNVGESTRGVSFAGLYKFCSATSGAPNNQFVEKCVIIPQLMKIYVIKAFSGVFQYCWEKRICSFFPARHTRNFPTRKIKLVGFPASCKVSSQQAEERRFSTSYLKMGVAKGLQSTLPWGGGGGGGGSNLISV